jgi:hypothetical protein
MRQNAGRDTSSVKSVFCEGPLSQVSLSSRKLMTKLTSKERETNLLLHIQCIEFSRL